MQKLLHLVAAILFLHLETSCSFLSERAFPSLLVSFRNLQHLPGGGWEGHDFPALELFPMALAACPPHADGWQCSSSRSRLKAGKLHSISPHRQPCFADFPTHCIQPSQHFLGPRNSSDHQFPSPKWTHEYLLIQNQVSPAPPKDWSLLFKTGAFH